MNSVFLALPLAVFAEAQSFEFVQTVRTAFEGMATDLANLVPKLVAGLLIAFVGWVAAKLVSRMIALSFSRTGLDKLFPQSALGQSLAGIGIKPVPGVVVSRTVYWLTLLFTLRAAARSAGLVDVSSIVDAVFLFLPKGLTAMIILTAGFFVADLLRKTSQVALSRLSLDFAGPVSTILFGLVLVIVITVALAQLGIQADLLVSCVQILLAAGGLAIALGLGLGMKDAAAALIAGIYARDVFRPGARVRLDDEEFELTGIGPLTAKLRRDDGSFQVIPNVRLTRETLAARPPVEE